MNNGNAEFIFKIGELQSAIATLRSAIATEYEQSAYWSKPSVAARITASMRVWARDFGILTSCAVSGTAGASGLQDLLGVLPSQPAHMNGNLFGQSLELPARVDVAQEVN